MTPKVRTEELHLELVLNVTKVAIGLKTALHLVCHQNSVQTVDKQDTEELIAPICLDKVG